MLAFGQPAGGISQFAYVVEDIDQSMADITAELGVGPWFVRGPFTPPEGRYRGEPTRPLVTLARGFSGHAMVELIFQHDDTPSVFHPDPAQRGYGFHHWAVITRSFDEDHAHHVSLGHEEAFSDRLPSGSRVAYMDATPALPGMIELVEWTEEQEAVYTEMYEAARGWDGSDPVRRPDG
jgi:hypothetical protein